MTIVFVTGTDTNVGKTIVAASLAARLRLDGRSVGVVKPVATGVEGESCPDAELLALAADTPDPPSEVCPVRLRAPLAPLTAAELAGVVLHPREIVRHCLAVSDRHEITIIEGAGGAAVPLWHGYLMSHLARDLNAHTILVARTALGTVNHTILTVEHLRANGVEPIGVIFCETQNHAAGLAEQYGPPLAAQYAAIPNLGTLPYVAALAGDLRPQEALAHLPVGTAAIARAAAGCFARPE